VKRGGTATERLAADEPGIARAAALLRAGRLVAFPTETVYGLGADARDQTAVRGIFAAKNRPAFNPLIVHVGTLEEAAALARFPPGALRLARAFWPGPLTLVLPRAAGSALAPAVTAGLPSVALRVPEHPLARRLLKRFSGPLAAPSANPSGRISPTRAEHVLAGLGGRIAAVLDGGPCAVGIESTIIGFDPVPALLRPGGLPAEAVERCLGRTLAAVPKDHAGTPTAPGQLASHYAPGAALRLNATDRRPGELLLGFGAMECDLNLSPGGDLAEAAARLFDALRRLDEQAGGRGGRIAVAPIPDRGLGRGINDRLRRAAAPRR